MPKSWHSFHSMLPFKSTLYSRYSPTLVDIAFHKFHKIKFRKTASQSTPNQQGYARLHPSIGLESPRAPT